MPIKIKPAAPVTVPLEVEGAGSCSLLMRPTAGLHLTRLMALVGEINSAPDNLEPTAQAALLLRVIDPVLELVEGWDGVQDAKGRALPFCRQQLEALLSQPGGDATLAALLTGYLAALQEARAGN